MGEAEPGDTISVRGSAFRVGTEASFLYAATITVGGVPIDSVTGVDLNSGNLHPAKYTESGLHIAEHIEIDPATTTPTACSPPSSFCPTTSPRGPPTRSNVLLERTRRRLSRRRSRTLRHPGPGGGVNDRVAMAGPFTDA